MKTNLMRDYKLQSGAAYITRKKRGDNLGIQTHIGPGACRQGELIDER